MTTRDRLARAGEVLERISEIRAKVPQGVRDRRRGCALRMQVRAILVGVLRSPSATDRDVQEAGALFEALGAQGFQGFIQNEVGVNSGFGG